MLVRETGDSPRSCATRFEECDQYTCEMEPQGGPQPLLWRLAAIGESPFFRPCSNSGCVRLQALLSGAWRSATLFSYTWNLGLLTQLCPRIVEDRHLQVTLVSGRNITIDKLNAQTQRYRHMKRLQVSTRAGECSAVQKRSSLTAHSSTCAKKLDGTVSH
jgi:hypothetical protein